MYTVNYIDITALVSSRDGMRAGPAPAMPTPPPEGGGGLADTCRNREHAMLLVTLQSPRTQTSHILTRLGSFH
jgi:hypothetical protein